MNLAGLAKQIGRIERAAGLGPCEACASAAELERQSEALRVMLRVPDLPPDTPSGEMIASCCGRVMRITLFAFTPEEVAAFERWERLFRDGEICRPEFVAADDELQAALDRSMAERYGPHLGAFRELYDSHRERRELGRAPSPPYFCRVPGCRCAYPKQFAA